MNILAVGAVSQATQMGINWALILQSAVGVLFGGGLLTALIAFFKLRPEAGQIVVTAAQGALIVQSGVIDDLNSEITRLKAVIVEQDKEISALKQRLKFVEDNQKTHDIEVKDLQNKVT